MIARYTGRTGWFKSSEATCAGTPQKKFTVQTVPVQGTVLLHCTQSDIMFSHCSLIISLRSQFAAVRASCWVQSPLNGTVDYCTVPGTVQLYSTVRFRASLFNILCFSITVYCISLSAVGPQTRNLLCCVLYARLFFLAFVLSPCCCRPASSNANQHKRSTPFLAVLAANSIRGEKR